MSDEQPDLSVLPVAESGQAAELQGTDEDGLTPLQARFVELIASGETMRGAAIELDRSERTLRRWKSATTIKAAIRDRLAEALARARAILSAGAGEAAAALVGMAGGTVAAEAARCAAARAVLENATKLGEIAAIEERLAEVESRLGPGRGRL